MQVTQETGAGAGTQRPYRWPESEFYVSEKHRLVYCPIQKVACSSLKLWWAELVDGSSGSFVSRNEFGQTSIDHAALNERYKLHHQSLSPEHRPLTDDNWLRAVFVRNPWARLVSAFLNKFVPLHDLARPLFNEAHLRWGIQGRPCLFDAVPKLLRWSRRAQGEQLRVSIWPWIRGEKAWRNEFTYRHFVEYLASCGVEDEDVDLHWRPQYRFLGETAFNFVGRFERLAEDFQAVANRTGVRIDLPAANRTGYKHIRRRRGTFADCPLKHLRRLPAMPDYRQFYTPHLRARVADIYRQDIERFAYDFDG